MVHPPAWEGFGACGPGHSILGRRPQPGLVESRLRANVRHCACWSPFSSESWPVSHVTQNLPSTVVSPTRQSQHWGRHCPPSTQPVPRLTPFSLPVYSRGADQLSPLLSALLVASVQRLSRGQQVVQPAVRAVGSSPFQIMRP